MGQPLEAVLRNASQPAFPEQDLRLRVWAEFHEMPGMRLTLPQAARLFSIEAAACERILSALVQVGDLVTDGRTFGLGARESLAVRPS